MKMMMVVLRSNPAKHFQLLHLLIHHHLLERMLNDVLFIQGHYKGKRTQNSDCFTIYRVKE